MAVGMIHIDKKRTAACPCALAKSGAVLLDRNEA